MNAQLTYEINRSRMADLHRRAAAARVGRHNRRRLSLRGRSN